jgi:hypothetical protein
LLDTDLGQKIVGPPATITLGYPDLSVPGGRTPPALLHFVGSTNAADRLADLMGDRGRHLPQEHYPIHALEIRLGLLQSLRGEHVLREIAGDRERGLHPLGARPQRRIGHRQVAPAVFIGEPPYVADLFARETPVQIRFDRLLEDFDAKQVG